MKFLIDNYYFIQIYNAITKTVMHHALYTSSFRFLISEHRAIRIYLVRNLKFHIKSVNSTVVVNYSQLSQTDKMFSGVNLDHEFTKI